MTLPPYAPPSARQATVAATLSPPLALLNFAALAQQWIEPDSAVAGLLALSVWVVAELWRLQAATDRYNDAYVHQHLAWRSHAALRALLAHTPVGAPARSFVTHYLDAAGTRLHHGPSL